MATNISFEFLITHISILIHLLLRKNVYIHKCFYEHFQSTEVLTILLSI